MPPDVVDIQIRPGMSEAVDPRMLPMAPAAVPRAVVNYRYRQLQRPEKRPGAATRGTTGLPTSGSSTWLTEWGGLDVAGIEASSSSQVTNTAYARDASGQWSLLGRHGFVVPERRFGLAMFQESSISMRGASCVAIGGVLYVAYASSSTAITLCALDPSGVILRENTVSTAANGRLVYDGTTLYLVYRLTSGGGTTINAAAVLLDSLLAGAATGVGTLQASTDVHDVAPLESSAMWLLAYRSGATQITVKTITGTTTTSTATKVTSGTSTFEGISGQEGNKVVLTYIDGASAAMVVTWNCASGSLSGASTVTVQTAAGNEAWSGQTSSVRVASDRWHLVYPGSDSVTSPTMTAVMFYHARVDTSGAVVAGTYKVFHAVPVSKVFATGTTEGRASVLAATWFQNTTQTGYEAHVFLDLAPSAGGVTAQVSGWSVEHAAKANTSQLATVLPEVVDLGSGRRFTTANWQDRAEPYSFNGLDGMVFRNATTSTSRAWSGRQVGNAGAALVVSGGCLYEHTSASNLAYISGDSTYLVENGFIAPPKLAVQASAGGSLTADQEYTFCAVYAWTDPQGRVHKSAPGPSVTVTPTGGNLTASLRASTLTASGRFATIGGTVVAEVYVSWGGRPFNLAGKTSSVVGTALSVTLTHSASDSDTEDNQPLYSDSVFANYPPSGGRLWRQWGVRLACVGWQENEVELTKTFVPTAPWEFVDRNEFRVSVPDPITALGWMDGCGVIFTAAGVYIVAGDGPDDQGGGGQFEPPRRVPSTVGADSPHVVEVPQGLIFKGAGTLWLLPRGFGHPQPVGDAIQETLASFPYLRGAVRCSNADDDVTHFTLAASDAMAAETKVAIWDNRLGAWSLDDIAGEVGAAGSVNGVFTWLLPMWDAAADIPVRQFSTASTTDYDANGSAAWIESRIDFGDWRPAGIAGWGDLRRLVVHQEAVGRCIAKLAISVDHANATTYSKTYSAASGAAYCELGHSNIKGTAYRISLFDAEDSGKTAGMVFHGLTIELHPAPGLRRVDGATERFA